MLDVFQLCSWNSKESREESMNFNRGNTEARILFLAVLQVLPAFTLNLLAPALELAFSLCTFNRTLAYVCSLVLSAPACFYIVLLLGPYSDRTRTVLIRSNPVHKLMGFRSCKFSFFVNAFSCPKPPDLWAKLSHNKQGNRINGPYVSESKMHLIVRYTNILCNTHTQSVVK